MYTRQQPADSRTGRQAGVQTRLPWWGVALPVVAFAALLALLAGGPASADASAAAPGADTLRSIAATLGSVLHHLL
nr:hypothetical protein [Actinacidiphila rubida]